MTCKGIAEYIRRIDYDPETKIFHAVMGYYDEIELTIFSDGKIRIDSCSMIMLDELLKTVECINEIHRQLRARENVTRHG